MGSDDGLCETLGRILQLSGMLGETPVPVPVLVICEFLSLDRQ